MDGVDSSGVLGRQREAERRAPPVGDFFGLTLGEYQIFPALPPAAERVPRVTRA